MSGLQSRAEESINGVDVREQGNTLRVATNTPHLVSLGTGRLSTAVTLHPIKQGRVTVGSDPTCDIYVVGTGVASVHCRVENSHGVVTLYPVAGSTLVDSTPVDKPTRLSQGSMLTIGRSNYLRFNHPAEAMLMKSVLPSARRDQITAGYVNVTHTDNSQCYQPKYKDLSQVDQELDITLKELSRTKPPVAPKDDKLTSIMSKVSKFEYYAKQHKNVGRSQFYTNTESEISPKVFSANSLTVNTPAKDVLGGKTMPNYMKKDQKVMLNDNNTVDPKSCSYANVAIRNNTKIGDIVKNFDEKLPKKVNNDVINIYGKINTDRKEKSNVESVETVDFKKETKYEYSNQVLNDISRSYKDTSFEISRSNQDRSQEYSRIKQDFFNKVTNDDYSKKNQDLHQRDHELSRSYQDTNHVSRQDSSRSQDRQLDISRSEINQSEMYRSPDRYTDSTRNQDNEDSRRQNDHPRSQDRQNVDFRSQDRQNDDSRNQDRHNDSFKSQNRYAEGSRSHDRCTEPSRSNKEASRSPSNGIGVPQYSPVYANQYERAESMRVKAYQERVKEEEKKEAEMERLEEILDIFTEYQKQLSTDFRPGVPITPTEKRPHNKIITNGSLPRSVAYNNPNFVKTSEGYYKFETSESRNEQSPSLPRNMSSYENFEPAPSTPEVTIPDNNYENIGRMDEIGIPVFDDSQNPNYEPTKLPTSPSYEQSNDNTKTINPMGSPYENFYVNRTVYNNLKPKSPNTNSPRTRIKTTFAHKNLTSPQYFIFPTPPPGGKKPNFNNQEITNDKVEPNVDSARSETKKETEKIGIEKQLSLEEDIPMIDDAELANDIEFRCSVIKNDTVNELKANQSFDDVKKELMADIPELEAFENDLKNHKRDKIIKKITDDIKTIDIDVVNSVLDVNIDDLKGKYEKMKEERRKLVTEIHEVKCKMTEITSQEDDILRELEMEKALIKGEYDSEIAILKIEQKKKADLVDKAKRIEEEIKQLREKQETRQNEMRDRVEIATMKVERLEKDLKSNRATLEELQNAQDILDNESKIYEDLEFQHLEEESELLSNREDLQNEIILLSKKIEAQKTRILTLKSEANNNLTSALDETKVLHTEYVKHLNNVEELTAKVQAIERELKPIVAKLNEIERAQSPDSAFYTDQTRTKSGEFGYSPQSSDSDDIDTKISNFEEHTKELKDKFNSIDQMSQSMTVDIEKRVTENDSPKSKEKKGFWERNFDSLKRKKKPKSPEKVDIMSQSLNENLFYNNEIIENDSAFDRFGSLRHSKKKDKNVGPVKSNSSSKIPTFAALGKIIKKDSFGKKSKDDDEKTKYIKHSKPSENKYKSKSLSPDKINEKITEENEDENIFQTAKVLHRKSCGDEPNTKDTRISDSGKIPSQDDIDRISKVTFDAPLLSSDTDVNSLGKRTLDSLMEIERKRFEMLEEQGCQMIENEREKISELKRRAQDETKKLWDQKYREKSVDSDFNSLTDDRRNSSQSTDSKERLSGIESTNEKIDRAGNFDRYEKERSSHDNTGAIDRSNHETGPFERKNEHNKRQNESSARSVLANEKSVDLNQSESVNRSKLDRSVNFDRATEKFERSVNFDRSVTDRLERQEMHDYDRSMEFDRSGQFDRSINAFDQSVEDSSLIEDGFMGNSTMFEENSGLMSSSIEELQVRNSRTESTEDEKRSDDSRPLSHASDFSRDNILSLSNAPRRSRRGVAPYSESQRPLTRYLPVDRDDFDLRRHVESAGHQIELCPYVTVTSGSCRGYLHKLGAKFHTWSKRWFVFDRETKTFVYYWDKSEKKPRGGAYFQVIEEVYLDHGNTSKSPSPQTTFIVKTRQRRYYLMAPSGEAARIWIDAIFTGAQGYTEYLE